MEDVHVALQPVVPSQSSKVDCTRPSPQYGAFVHTLVHTVFP
jgi:hypothetical protein